MGICVKNVFIRIGICVIFTKIDPSGLVGDIYDAIPANLSGNASRYALIRKEDNMLIGCAGLKMGKDSCSGKQDEPELGYWIGRQFWGKGYATEAGERLLRHAFEDMNSNAVWCCYYDGNERSKRVQEKLRFTYVRTDPQGDTLLGYTLPEIENVLRKADFDGRRGARTALL